MADALAPAVAAQLVEHVGNLAGDLVGAAGLAGEERRARAWGAARAASRPALVADRFSRRDVNQARPPPVATSGMTASAHSSLRRAEVVFSGA